MLWLVVPALLIPGTSGAKGPMEKLSNKIMRAGDTNDEKMARVEAWVRANIEYVPDIVLYGKGDVAFHPSVTIRKGRADCEDGALLAQALAAYGGIPVNRVRTLFTLHNPQEGHAWNLYKRESAGQWVPVDWTWDAPPDLDSRSAIPGLMPFSWASFSGSSTNNSGCITAFTWACLVQ